jgi:RNA polymerase sigma-70 factor (ECF subfamily)
LIDPELIEECRRGNLQNFRKLIEVSSPMAYSVAFRMTGDEEEAKDIVQETMIILWSRLKKLKTTEAYKSWLYRIVLNKCYDYLRIRKKKLEVRPDEKAWELIADNTPAHNASELGYKETALVIEMLTEKLSPVQKAVFVLGYLEEKTNEEISVITGMSSRNVKANLHYARKKMCEMIKNHI